jgi:subtilisin family serine protease
MYSVNYRGNAENYKYPVYPDAAKGQLGYIHGHRYASIDAELQDCIDAGIIVVHAAGNTGHKIDLPGGKDYDNYYTFSPDPFAPKLYYHRGSSPSAPNCITVSAADSQIQFDKKEIKERLVYFSERGPGCDIVAPGTAITAGTSANAEYQVSEYMWGTEKQRGHNVATLSGTSMAAPQVTGVLALYLSGKPQATPAQAKKWLADQAINDVLVGETNDADYQNDQSLLKGPNKYLYNPYRNKFKDI